MAGTLRLSLGIWRHVAESQAHQVTVLKAMISSLRPELLAFARYLMASDDDANDVVQQTMEIALRRHSELRDRAKLKSWLFAIETREATRWRRRIRSFVRLDTVVRDISATGPPLDRSVAIRIAVEALPRRTRQAIVLHYMVGLTVSDTARALRVSENTVKTQLRIGLHKLREDLT